MFNEMMMQIIIFLLELKLIFFQQNLHGCVYLLIYRESNWIKDLPFRFINGNMHPHKLPARLDLKKKNTTAA